MVVADNVAGPQPGFPRSPPVLDGGPLDDALGITLSPLVSQQLLPHDRSALRGLLAQAASKKALAALLGEMRDPAATKVLIQTLATRTPKIRAALIKTLGAVGGDVRDSLLTEVSASGRLLINTVADWLGRLDETGRTHLSTALGKMDLDTLSFVAAVADKSDPRQLSALLGSLAALPQLTEANVRQALLRAKVRLDEPPPSSAKRDGQLETPQEWKAGIRRPYGPVFTEQQIDRALAFAQGTIRVEDTAFPGTRVFRPNDGKTHPAIFLLHGSEGGSAGANEMSAIAWARKGYTVMSYAYFGTPGTPHDLQDIPLDKAIDAMRWLKSSPGVGGQPLAVMGVSRGAEMAVLLGSILGNDPLVSAVLAHSPQDKVQGALAMTRDRLLFPDDPNGKPVPAWTYRGKPIDAGTPIALDKFEGPVFLSEGLEDEVWPAKGAIDLEQRLEASGHPPVAFYAGGQGHVFTGPAWEREMAAQDMFLRQAVQAQRSSSPADGWIKAPGER
jgi:acetyl esterase/lipase